MNFEQLIGDLIAKDPLFVLITGDLNVRKTNWWWKNDLSTSEGTQVDLLTTSYGLSQIISDPTHILPNSYSCNDLIFTNPPNLVTELMHPSINRVIDIFNWSNSFEGKNVHKQVHFFKKKNLNIFHNYIPNKTILCNDKDPQWFNSEKY